MVGGLRVTGSGRFIGPVVQGSRSDPLASLPVPGPPSPTFSAVTYSGGGTLTLQPGTYVGGIVNSGPGQIVLSAGLYYLKGGGLAVTAAGSITGTGVVIYNAPQNSSDGIKLTGTGGSINLSAPTSGTYAGIAVFQDRSSAAALTISSKGTFNITGTVYEPHAAMIVSGSANVVFHGDPTHGISGRFIGYDLTDSSQHDHDQRRPAAPGRGGRGDPRRLPAGADHRATGPGDRRGNRDLAQGGCARGRSQAAQAAPVPDRQPTGAELGEEDGHLIEISPDAAGYGWSLGRVPDPGRMDLLTVVAHEMGHVLGLADTDTSDLMGSTLPRGVRRLPSRSELTPRLRVRPGTIASAALARRPSPWSRAERMPPSWGLGRGKHRGHDRP